MAKTTAEQLIELKKKIEERKAAHERAQGKLDALYDQLHREFAVKTVEAGEALLKKLQKELVALDEEVYEGLRKLEEEYGGNDHQGTREG